MRVVGIITFIICFIASIFMFSTASGDDEFSIAFCGIGLYFLAKGIFLLGYSFHIDKK